MAVAALTTAATPTPSPHLESQLAAPPAGYVEDTESTGTPIGEFDAGAYITYLGADDPDASRSALLRDGFVTGYGKSWTQDSTGEGLVEIVVAFSGGAGARHWLTTSEIAARRDTYYKSDITVSGIGAYVGVRYVDSKTSAEADVVQFVKGNDYFLVGYVSQGRDLTAAAAAQSKLQYDFAAAESIPPSRWPETPRPSAAGPLSVGAAVLVLLLLALFAAVWWLTRRRRSGAARPVDYVWDGETWRTADGKLSWDGNSWREVPAADR